MEKETIETSPNIIKKALLVGVYATPAEKSLCDEHLTELRLLTQTYGAQVVETVICHVRKYDASTLIGKGKLEELVARTKELEVNMVIFDHDISPGQQRNLEGEFGITVMDRTEVIIEVFAQRARTKEARLQVALAKTRYESPRLKRLWTHLSRQNAGGGGGSGAYLKGEGEKQIEIDRRIIKKKIDSLKAELEEVRHYRETQRTARVRSDIPIFAIVGYTNAGKSTLLNALTDAGVFVEDKLFATLDTTTRKFTLSNNQEILLIDTVGFIRKLPHFLVAAFRSTLEEVTSADILLHLVDASHSAALEQAATSFEVIKELNAEEKPVINVLNKIDKCENPKMLTKLRLEYPRTVQISALTRLGFADLETAMLQELAKRRKQLNLRIPQIDYHVVSEILRLGTILNQEYEENDVLLKVDLPATLAGKLDKYLVKTEEVKS